jgi:hypothetical protein
MRRKPPKFSTTLYIAPTQHRPLTQLARRLDVSMGHLIREGINLVLAKYAKEGKR